MVEKKDLNQMEVRAALRGEKVTMQSGGTGNRRGRGRTAGEKREAYNKYYAMKKKVIELEERNKRYLVLWPASDADVNENTFYNMGGTSAIIYVHEIAPRLKRKATLRRDMEHGEARFHSGICSVRDIDKLTELLKTLNIERLERKIDDGLIYYKLGRDYEKTEIKEMLRLEQNRLDELNRLLYSQVLHPEIHKYIIEIKRLIPAKVKNMDKGYRDLFGPQIVDNVMKLIHTYSMMAHGDLDEKEAAHMLMKYLDMLQVDVSMINELKLWEVSSCARVALIFTEMKKSIKGRILNK